MARRFFPGTAASYDLTVHLWTFGLDWWWKKRLLDKVPPGSRRILDQACGTGILTFRMARRFPSARITGVDLHREYLLEAARKAESRGIKNVQFIQGLAEEVSLRDRFDCITSSYLAKYAHMENLIAGAGRMLRRGGVLIMHDFTYPRNSYIASTMGLYFRVMQAVGSRAFPEWKNVFFELEGFLRESRWVSDLVASLEKNAFEEIHVERFTLGAAGLVYATRTC